MGGAGYQYFNIKVTDQNGLMGTTQVVEVTDLIGANLLTVTLNIVDCEVFL